MAPLTLTPADIAKEAIDRFLKEADFGHQLVRVDLAQALAIEHVRGLCEGAVIAFDAPCCGAEPDIVERHTSDCYHRPPRSHDCIVCRAMR